MELDARVGLGRLVIPEAGRTNKHLMGEGSRGSLCPGIDPMAHRAALHENDRVMSVLAGDGGGQTCDKPRPGSPGDLLKTMS
jgi:hypothetical protein